MMFGMMVVNVLVVLFGECLVCYILLSKMCFVVVVLFVVFGVMVLVGVNFGLGFGSV